MFLFVAKVNENPSPYPLPSGERIKVRGALRVKFVR